MYDIIIFTDNTDDMQISIPLGAFKIASVLRKNGYKTLVINHLSKFNLDELKILIDVVMTDSVALVGFSTTFLKNSSFSNNDTLGFLPQGKSFENDLFEYIRNKNEKVKFVLGGANTSMMCSNKNINYVILGYAEASIVNLMNHLKHGVTLEKATKNIFGITVIDDRTAPTYNFNQDEMIWEKTDICNHTVLPLEIGRGCIFKCKFCSYPLNGKKNVDYIKHPDVFYNELLRNYTEFKIKHYFFVDDTFNDTVEKLNQLEQVVKRLPFQPIFWCYARLDLICTRPETLDTLYNIGCRAFYFGIETLNERTGRIIGKGYDREKQIQMIALIKEKYPSISMHGSFIMGLPEEPLESLLKTVDQLLKGEILLDSWMMKPLYIMSTKSISFLSDIDINPEKYGYIIKESPNIKLWKNEHIDFFKARQITDSFIKDSRTKPYFKVPGHDSFEFVNYGMDFATSKNTSFKDMDFEFVKTQAVPQFIANYKSQLFRYLKEGLN